MDDLGRIIDGLKAKYADDGDAEVIDLNAGRGGTVTERVFAEMDESYMPPKPPPPADTAANGQASGLPKGRKLRLTPASSIEVQAVKWLWLDRRDDPTSGRLALGTLGIVCGVGGLGKSTFTAERCARITRGQLPGAYYGEARAVVIATTEDSWQHTIVPRLMAAGADLDRVYRVDVTTSQDADGYLSFPRDLKELERLIQQVGAVLIVLDPLTSRLEARLDTHKAAEVRQGLEPIVSMADRARAAVWGIMHFNKRASTDSMSRLMASAEFGNVARSVLVFAEDPDDANATLVGQRKNNLGRKDLPTLRLRIEGVHVTDDVEGEPVWTSRIAWAGESDLSIDDALAVSGTDPDDRTAVEEAGEWLADYLKSQGGRAESSECKAEGRKAGHSADALKRARRRKRVGTTSGGFPRKTWWALPDYDGTTASEGGE